MAGMLRVSRSRGALSGVLLVLLGIWGGLIPLVGPYVNYAYTPDHAWTLNSGRIWLEILPAAGTLLGGLILLGSKLRPMALTGACLAAASGAWFAVGSALAPLWTTSTPIQGYPVGSHIAKVMEQISFFTGLGVVIVCVASLALGRLSVVTVRDAAARAVTETPAAVETDTAAHDGEVRDDTAPQPAAATTRRWPSARTARMRRVATSDQSGATADSNEPIGSSARS
jgi:hypothetical protein